MGLALRHHPDTQLQEVRHRACQLCRHHRVRHHIQTCMARLLGHQAHRQHHQFHSRTTTVSLPHQVHHQGHQSLLSRASTAHRPGVQCCHKPWRMALPALLCRRPFHRRLAIRRRLACLAHLFFRFCSRCRLHLWARRPAMSPHVRLSSDTANIRTTRHNRTALHGPGLARAITIETAARATEIGARGTVRGVHGTGIVADQTPGARGTRTVSAAGIAVLRRGSFRRPRLWTKSTTD
mmetsp:Transcript_39099/g.125714  ORF Transcript_39099/g.125714 Transcript_39099/m.125714 type:complete len:237 (-) Transcript_39099:4992-5702(-)